MLSTNLIHIENEIALEDLLKNNSNVMICCGRMGPMCIPVYGVMEKIKKEYPHVQFRDMDFDILEANYIKNLPECSSFRGLPFTVYFKDGKAVKATTSIQEENQIIDILESVFKI